MIKKVFLLPSLFLAVLTCLYPTVAKADSWKLDVNQEYLKNDTFSTNQKLVEIQINVPPQDYTTYKIIPKKLKFYSSPNLKSSDYMECSFGATSESSPLDCGLVPLSVGEYDYNFTYTFKLVQQKGSWFKIPLYIGKPSVWINAKENPNVSFSILGFVKWRQQSAQKRSD